MTIDELFAKAQSRAAENVQFVIDENLRIITVPESAAVFGVETDKDVNTASFTINRFYSEVDLSEFSIRVSFANANNEMDFFDATDITVEDSTVSFNWLMGASAFKYKGTIQFAVNFFKADSSGTIQQAYNTTIATGQCLSGLNVNTADLPDTDYSELILHIQQQIQQTGQEQVQAVNDAGAQKLSQINAANARPPQPNTATGVWQTWDQETGQYVDTTAPYRGQGVPDPTPADAGKVPVVNAEGTAYTLEEIPTGGGGTGQPGADGEDGGYYTPSVDGSGYLSWTASKAGMPPVEGTNIRGPEGPQGDPGPTGPEGPPYTLTEEDKQTIVQAVITALPDGDAVSYGAPEPGIVTTDNQYYTAIAAAIRQKLGTSTEYQPAQMAAAIESISTAAGIPVTFTGNPVVATDTIADQPFAGLKVYGKSTQDGTPSPENPVDIVSAGEGGSIELAVTGINLFDYSKLIENKVYSATGEMIASTGYMSTQKIPVVPGIVYRVNANSSNVNAAIWVQWDKDGNILLRESSKPSNYAQALLNNAAFLGVTFYSELNAEWLLNAIISAGSEEINFVPFQGSQSLTLSTPSGLPGIPVTSGGNFTDASGQQWWSDVKDLAAETETQNVLDITFDGSTDENWTVQSGSEIGNRFYIIIRPTVTASDSSNISSLNSLLPLGANGETFRKTYCYTITGGSISQLYISLSGSEDLDGLRAYLQANPMRILARLVEPTTSPLTSEEITAYNGLRSYANTTVISTAEPVAGMEATVYCDAGATIQRLQGEIQTLSDATALNTQTLNTMLGAE